MNKLKADIADRGFALICDPVTDDAFVALATKLGAVINDTQVALREGRRTYLTSPDAIPLHTDHPDASLIAWRCDAQDRVDGASLLVDGFEVLNQLDAALQAVPRLVAEKLGGT